MTRLRLASYNVQKAVGSDLRRRPDRTLDVIAELGADILALQEADKRLPPRPSPFDPDRIAERTGLRPLEIADTGRSLGHHGNAILVRPGIDAREVRQLELPGFEPRGGLRAELVVGGHPVTIIGTHLGLLRRDRLRQAAALTAQVQNARHAAVLGDFNEWRAIGGLAPLAEALTLVTPGPSFHAARPIAALDRVALRGMDCDTCGVWRTRPAHRASDHLPVWFDVILHDT